jgi:hypothetical protein
MDPEFYEILPQCLDVMIWITPHRQGEINRGYCCRWPYPAVGTFWLTIEVLLLASQGNRTVCLVRGERSHVYVV